MLVHQVEFVVQTLEYRDRRSHLKRFRTYLIPVKVVRWIHADRVQVAEGGCLHCTHWKPEQGETECLAVDSFALHWLLMPICGVEDRPG